MSTSQYAPNDRAMLLELARLAIQESLEKGRLPNIKGDYIPPGLGDPKACFVTLTKEGKLRGCMGNLDPKWRLYRAVMENAQSAAIRDPRFPPLEPTELEEVLVEISILSTPRPLEFSSPSELGDRLRPHQDGVILRCRNRTATYLPQVWDKLPDPARFMDSLSRKAGLPSDAWQDQDARISTYQVESIAEDRARARAGG